MANAVIVHRGGMLLTSEQLEEREAPRQDIPPELIIEFCRALIQNTMSEDIILLSAYAARDRTNSTGDEMQELLRRVYYEVKRR